MGAVDVQPGRPVSWATSWQRWHAFTVVEGSTVRVELSGQDVCDADLPSLFRHVGLRLQSAGGRVAFALDLSDNPRISDYGVTTSLVPFLRQWPECHSLKLCRTCIGDSSLQALTDWMSKSVVHEIHLSQLGGSVTSKVAMDALQAIIASRKTLQKDRARDDMDALWLCLELNGIEVECSQCSHVNFWERTSVGLKRHAACKSNKIPFVELVLFPSAPAPPRNRGKEILSMLQGKGVKSVPVAVQASEPLALSVDEFRLWCMETREAAEAGADRKNLETFGQESVAGGWSFERNVEANRLLTQGLSKPCDKPDLKVQKPAKQDQKQQKQEKQEKQKAQKPEKHERHEKRERQQRRDRRGKEEKQEKQDKQVKPVKPEKPEKREGGKDEKLGVCDADAKRERRERRARRADLPEHAAKAAVDSTVRHILRDSSVLHAGDFRSSVREWLVAIYADGGARALAEAAELVCATVEGKRREDVAKWTGYLAKLLERFHDAQKQPPLPILPLQPIQLQYQ